MKKAENHLEVCEYNCKFNLNNECVYGLRNLGCYLDKKKEEDMKLTTFLACVEFGFKGHEAGHNLQKILEDFIAIYKNQEE